MAGFKDFLPKGYSHLYIYDKRKREKVEVSAELIKGFHSMSSKETAVIFYEGKKTRIMITPYTLRQIFTVFSEGE